MTVDELRAREAIRVTLARYNAAGDRGRLSELAACFTADGVFELPDEDALVGPAAIEARLVRTVSALKAATVRPFVQHHVASPHIELVSDSEATSHAYYLVVTEAGPDHAGRYQDRLRRTGELWLFSHRRVRVDWHAEHSRMLQDRGR